MYIQLVILVAISIVVSSITIGSIISCMVLLRFKLSVVCIKMSYCVVCIRYTTRAGCIRSPWMHETVSKEHQRRSFYSMKVDTRVEGPWDDTNEGRKY